MTLRRQPYPQQQTTGLWPVVLYIERVAFGLAYGLLVLVCSGLAVGFLAAMGAHSNFRLNFCMGVGLMIGLDLCIRFFGAKVVAVSQSLVGS